MGRTQSREAFCRQDCSNHDYQAKRRDRERRSGADFCLKTRIVVIRCETCALRQQLVDWLIKKPMYISELAIKAKMDRTTVAYHLGQMEHDGILTSEYRLLDSKKAARYYSPTFTA